MIIAAGKCKGGVSFYALCDKWIVICEIKLLFYFRLYKSHVLEETLMKRVDTHEFPESVKYTIKIKHQPWETVSQHI